jgi:hypothetical protein
MITGSKQMNNFFIAIVFDEGLIDSISKVNTPLIACMGDKFLNEGGEITKAVGNGQ